MIQRVGPNKYVVTDKDGKKRLSKPMSKRGAKKQLHAIEYKNKGAGY